MRRLKVIIHGGMHKTATTSLQHTLTHNREVLLKRGILYPDFGRPHHHRHLSTKEDSWSPALCAEAVAVAEATGAHTLVMSAEGVSMLSAEQFKRLGRAFDGHELTYVFCLRHWNTYMPSRWAQNCRRRDAQTFAEYVRAATAKGSDHIDFRFDRILHRAEESADCRVRAVSYDNAAASGGVVSALLRAMDFDDALVALLSGGRRTNQSPPSPVVELSRLFNGVLSSRLKLRQNELFLSIGEFGISREFFDLPKAINGLDEGLLADLKSIVVENSIAAPFEASECNSVEQRLASKHAGRITNLIDGKVFAHKAQASMVTTGMSWEEFCDRAGGMVDSALTQMAAHPVSLMLSPDKPRDLLTIGDLLAQRDGYVRHICNRARRVLKIIPDVFRARCMHTS